MKRLHLFEAVGLVDERLVEEAADAKRTAQPWSKWLAAAACAALALSLGTAAAGTLLRGCGSVNSSTSQKTEAATADMAAPAAPAADAAPAEEAVSEDSPEMEKYGDVQSSTEHQAAGAAVPESAPVEPEEPLPEPAAAPSGFDGMSNDSMGALQKVPELYAAAGEIVITLCETEEDGDTGIRRALYWVENQSGTERTEILHYTLCTGKEGMEGWNLEIHIDGETVPFDAYEATVCPAEAGTVPEPEERSYLIEFSATLSAKKRIEVEIQY